MTGATQRLSLLATLGVLLVVAPAPLAQRRRCLTRYLGKRRHIMRDEYR